MLVISTESFSYESLFPPDNRAVYEIMWKRVVGSDRTKATNTHSECIIVTAFSTPTVVMRTRLNVTLYVRRYIY